MSIGTDSFTTTLDPAGSQQDLHRVFDAARRFVACRELATAMASGNLPPARSLAEAIQRDFLAFDLTRAERELREAVIAAEPTLALPVPTLVFAGRSDVRRRRRVRATGQAAEAKQLMEA
jgi:hypothetical protein